MNKQMIQFVDNMIKSGVPSEQAIAVALSIEHCITNTDFVSKYGTYIVDALKEFTETVTK